MVQDGGLLLFIAFLWTHFTMVLGFPKGRQGKAGEGKGRQGKAGGGRGRQGKAGEGKGGKGGGRERGREGKALKVHKSVYSCTRAFIGT